MTAFETVRNYLLDLNYDILEEDQAEELFRVEKEDSGISNLIIDCEDPILIIELVLFKINDDKPETYKELLHQNRELVHGAFALTSEGYVIFRDTLQLENLDLNELEGTLNALELMLSEYGNRLIELSKL